MTTASLTAEMGRIARLLGHEQVAWLLRQREPARVARCRAATALDQGKRDEVAAYDALERLLRERLTP